MNYYELKQFLSQYDNSKTIEELLSELDTLAKKAKENALEKERERLAKEMNDNVGKCFIKKTSDGDILLFKIVGTHKFEFISNPLQYNIITLTYTEFGLIKETDRYISHDFLEGAFPIGFKIFEMYTYTYDKLRDSIKEIYKKEEAQ